MLPTRALALASSLVATGCCFAPSSAPPDAPAAPPPLAACTEPAYAQVVGYVLVREDDVVLSTSAGDLRACVGAAALDEALAYFVQAGDAQRPWFVLGAPSVERARIDELERRVRSLGYSDVRPCSLPPGWELSSDGEVLLPGAPVNSLPYSGEAEHRREPSRSSVQASGAEVRGSLSSDAVRRVVLRHIGEIRFCYEPELASHPALAGRVTLSFVIAASGSVAEARVRDTTLANERVESCILRAVQGWTFPAPEGGGVVAVDYPFVFASGS